MHRPVRITAPTNPVVSVAEAMRQCRIDAASLDETVLEEVTDLLEGYISSATEHMEGWNGILGGRCLMTQTWRQDFDGFERCIELALGPVGSITSVKWLDSANSETTIDQADYRLITDAGGRSMCRFRDSYSWPNDLYEVAAVSITYVAGTETPPTPIKQAILLMVGAFYENREETVVGVSIASLPHAVAIDRLISPYRRGNI